MDHTLEDIFLRAAHSNLTATAEEFVPRSETSSTKLFSDRDNSSRSNLFKTSAGSYEFRNDLSTSKTKKKRDANDTKSYYNNQFKHFHRENYNNSFPNSKNSLSRYKNKERLTETSNSEFERCNGYNENSTYYDENNHNVHKKTRMDTGGFTQQNSNLGSFRNYRDKFSDLSSNDKASCKLNFSRNTHNRSSDEAICQRDRLIEQLNGGVLECLVCCERVKQIHSVWSCNSCYHVLHLWCVIKWAKSSKNENGKWRCPACQFENEQIPEKYLCFCGKAKLQNECWNRSDTAHSCGEICGKNKENPTPWFICEHQCTLLCHPGPCPPCTVQVTRECGCGRTKRTVQCSTKIEIVCGAICDRLLNCGMHQCTRNCHFGDCGTCSTIVTVECFCGKSRKNVICGSTDLAKFSCERKCDRLLECGNHTCKSICHAGECGLCPRSPVVQNTCNCGKLVLEGNTRTSCLDPVPSCEQVCGRLLSCGPTNKKHTCESLCHEDECGLCPKETFVKCRCGNKEKSIPCAELVTVTEFKCQKKCVKKRSCGKHKCNQVCCIDTEHICPQRCSGTLNCGKHRCELLCHRGKCGRCLQSSFEELYCHCGHSVIYPPVPCGTKPPKCDQPCKRQHDCDHQPLHTCHSDRSCPPCIVFTDKLCYGEHEIRKTIPCYQKEFSCGLPCQKLLPCGVHKCQIPCHPGNCLSGSTKKCTQPCTKKRDLCGHPCSAACHEGICPDTVCKEVIKVTCACGNLASNHNCYEHTDDYKRIIARTLAIKMAELQLDDSVNISDVQKKINDQKINLRTLECNNECRIIMRNKRLALALQIQNPDMNAKFSPKYSDFMKTWAKKDPKFCQSVHDKLTVLVKLAKESKQKSRSFSFEIMNKEKRQFVHEYCAHFGCESEAYDAEPKRNVVAIAVRGRCWMPSASILEVIQREMGQRKVPVPMISKKPVLKNENITANSSGAVPTAIILPVLPSASSSTSGINYFGD